MKLFTSALVLLLLAGHVARADDATLKQFIKGKVQEINDAIVAGNFDKVADLTYPKVVEAMGGKEKMVAATSAAMKEMKAKGFEIRSCKTETPSDPLKSGSELFVVAPYVMEMKVPGGRLRQKTFVIGISADSGKTWLFVNGDMDIKLVRQFIPTLPVALKLPEKEKPVFEKE